MTLTATYLVLSFAMILLLSKHWVRVTRRDRAADAEKRMSTYLDWKVHRPRNVRKRGFFRR